MNTKYLPDHQIAFYKAHGYVVVEDIITPEEVEQYKQIYDDFLSGKIAVGANRSDLGANLGDNKKVENITQIMWPSEFVPGLLDLPYHQRALAISKELMGEDLEMDFDMLINKAPGTNTITPWHQDEAYWVNVPDKRASSCWLALDDATIDNGCMWFVPGSHLSPVRPHRFAAGAGGALTCDAAEEEGLAVALKAGSCTFHQGRTLHYSRSNSTTGNRRAFIVNFRAAEMIQLERSLGFDHGKNNASTRALRNDAFQKP
jgi:phytanoyl-CoA hydroxylase